MDFTCKKLKHDIEVWYDKHYPHIPAVKEDHVLMLEQYYDPERFRNKLTIAKERVKFLTELQGIVNLRWSA